MAKTDNIKIFTGIGLDFETGGLNCTKSACTQISLQAIRLDTFEVLERYTKYFSPYNKQNVGGNQRKVLKSKYEMEQEKEQPMEIGQVALDYSGITLQMLLSQGIDLNEIARETIEFAKRNTLTKGVKYRPVLIGQNIPFDIGFFQQMMNYAGLVKEFEKSFSGKIDFYGNFQPDYLDTISLARLAFAHDQSMTSYKLEFIAERLGIELDDAHDADADVTATLNIIRVLASRMRNIGGDVEGVIQKGGKSRTHFKI